MCRKLGIPRSLVYYRRKTRKVDSKLENAVIRIFNDSKSNYGSRKIKVELKKENIIASRRKIRRIMDKYGLVSNYTIKQFKSLFSIFFRTSFWQILPLTASKILAIRQYVCGFFPCHRQNHARKSAHKKILNRL